MLSKEFKIFETSHQDEFVKTLPPFVLELAARHVREQGSTPIEPKPFHALIDSFHWAATPEGSDFWLDVYSGEYSPKMCHYDIMKCAFYIDFKEFE